MVVLGVVGVVGGYKLVSHLYLCREASVDRHLGCCVIVISARSKKVLKANFVWYSISS